MKTTVISVDDSYTPDILQPALESLRSGGIVIFPTETVYAMSVNADDPAAVHRMLEIRQSPLDKRCSVLTYSQESLSELLGTDLPSGLKRVIRQFVPGPLTLIFDGKGGTNRGVRVPKNTLAVDFVQKAQVPVLASSVNLSGGEPAVTAEESLKLFDGVVDYVIDGGTCPSRLASTVVRFHDEGYELLREGAISQSLIDQAVIRTILLVCTGNTCRSPMAEVLFRDRLAKQLSVPSDYLYTRGYRVLSAGTLAGVGAGAQANALKAVESLGLDLRMHPTQPLTPSLLDAADDIFVMTDGHRDSILEWTDDGDQRIHKLDRSGDDIPDPVGGSLADYLDCLKLIEKGIEHWIHRMHIG